MRMPIGPAFPGDACHLDAQYLSCELFSSVPRARPRLTSGLPSSRAHALRVLYTPRSSPTPIYSILKQEAFQQSQTRSPRHAHPSHRSPCTISSSLSVHKLACQITDPGLAYMVIGGFVVAVGILFIHAGAGAGPGATCRCPHCFSSPRLAP